MTQAINRAKLACSTEQAATVDDLDRLKGVSSLLSFVASGAENLNGPPMWEALRMLDTELSTIVSRIEDNAERIRRRHRRAEPVRAILAAYWSGFGDGEDHKPIGDNPWSRRDSSDLHVAWVAGWRQSEFQSRI